MLVGISHAGNKHCGHDDKLSAYTSVYKYLDWICKTVDEKDSLAEACGDESANSMIYAV